MPAAIVAATLLVAASLTIGLAALNVCGRRDQRVVAGPVGLAILLALAGVAAGLGGRGAAIAAVLAAATIAAAVVVARTGLPPVAPGVRSTAIVAALVAGLFAALPFIAAGEVGILGVGLVNDDMASHLLLADWIDERFRPEPILVDQGYPLGPHALVAGLATILGATSIDVFAGLVLAVPALTAFVAAGTLADIEPRIAVRIAPLVAIPYLAAAYLAQEAFKEPILALLLLAFALYLPAARTPRAAIPLGVLAAGAVYVYSFPGLAWLAGTAVIWSVAVWRGGSGGALRGDPQHGREDSPKAAMHGRESSSRRGLPGTPAAVVLLALAVLVAPDLGRVVDFADFRALDPDRANEGGLGNLRGHLSPLEAFGIWPTSEFRLAAGAGALPAIAFYAGALVGAAGLALGLRGWVRRYGWAAPAALAAAVLIYAGARAFGTVYSSGKALAIAAPLVALITLGGLVGRRWALGLLAVAIALGMALSSFLVLRQAPVGPTAHMEELAEIRPHVEGRDVLFLGRDNFVLYELRGSRPYTHVRNFYDPYFVEPNYEIADVGSKFDFDALDARTLARFPFVITTRAAYASAPPPDYRAVLETESYVLWRRPTNEAERREIALRRPVEEGPAPGAVLGRDRCATRAPAAIVGGEPRLGGEGDWTPSSTVESGDVAAQTLHLGEGTWELSLQYDATRPVHLAAAGVETTLPANLDYRGVAPFWNAGRITLDEVGEVVVAVSVEEPPIAGRLLGADSVAHLGALAATRAGPSYVSGAEPPFPGTGTRLTTARDACGRYADWTASAR